MKYLPLSCLVLLACEPSPGSPVVSTAEEIYVADICGMARSSCFSDHEPDFLVALLRSLSDEDCRTFVRRVAFGAAPVDARVESEQLVDNGNSLCSVRMTQECRLLDFDDCHEPVEGKVALGAACAFSYECAGDAFCDEGSCAARVAPGGACSEDAGCSRVTGAFGCNDAGICVSLQVAVDIAQGQPCDRVGDDPIVLARCRAGLACGEDDTCAPIPAAGQACDGVCALGSICIGDEVSVCAALPFANTVGATCVEDPQVQGELACNIGLNLGCIDGKCVALGDGSRGARCVRFDLTGICDAGLTCDEATHTCQ